MSNFPVLNTDIKGPGWTRRDTLREIRQDTGRLGLSTVWNEHFTESAVLDRNMIYSNLLITDEALLNAGSNTVTVLGDCHIRSGRLTAGKLVVFGNLLVEPSIDFPAYSNLLTVPELIVHGNMSFKQGVWSHSQTIPQRIGGNLTIEGLTGASPIIHATSNAELHVGGDLSWPSLTAFARGVANMATSYALKIKVDGNASFPLLVTVDFDGSDYAIEPTAQDGHDFFLSAGGNLTVGAGLTIDASGGNGTNGADGGDGGDVNIHYGGSLSGSIASVNVAKGTGTPNGADGTYTTTNTVGADHDPGITIPVTAIDAKTDELTWDVPTDINGDTLDFRIRIERVYGDQTHVGEIDDDSDESPENFSGTPPYAEGTGTVTYTIPSDILAAGAVYRWKVWAFKESGDVVGIGSQWRRFIYTPSA